ncbi:MAG TPA: M56 family metallopeptidase, partial [Allosphingosinicella sp.]|nr:M56 family metallopeptidase [Allosphingosinicella sp.]
MDMSFFAEMAWKSALIAGAALVLAFVLRSRSAADRALVLRIGVAMLLLMPPIAMLLPSLQIEAWAAPEAPVSTQYLLASDAQLYDYAAGAMTAAEPTIWDDPTPLVLLAYLGGLMMAGSRLFAGLWMLGRWTAAAKPVTCPLWLAAFERTRWVARRPDRIRLMVSDRVSSPLSWGWARPVILIDPDALADPEEAEAILAHEMAHVVRGDWLVLILTRAAATLFWFNPLVWLLEREIVQQAEEAADCEAAKRVEPARYAQTLLTWAQIEARSLPAHSIAPKGSALGRRVKAILDRRIRERPSGSAWTAFAIVLCVAIAAPVAAMELVAAARAAPPAPVAPAAPGVASSPAAPAAPAASLGIAASAAAAHPHPPEAPLPPGAIHIDIPDVGAIVDAALAETLPNIPVIVASAMSFAHPQDRAWG